MGREVVTIEELKNRGFNTDSIFYTDYCSKDGGKYHIDKIILSSSGHDKNTGLPHFWIDIRVKCPKCGHKYGLQETYTSNGTWASGCYS